MDTNAGRDEMVEKLWRTYLTTGEFERERRQRHLFRALPGSPRCKNCYAPFSGVGGMVRAVGIQPFQKTSVQRDRRLSGCGVDRQQHCPDQSSSLICA